MKKLSNNYFSTQCQLYVTTRYDSKEEATFGSINWYFWAYSIGYNFEIQDIFKVFFLSSLLEKKILIIFLMFYKFLEQTITLISLQLALNYCNYLWHYTVFETSKFSFPFLNFLTETSCGFKEFIFWIVLLYLC